MTRQLADRPADVPRGGRPSPPRAARACVRAGPTERKIDPLALPLDKPDVWTLHFRYKPPRIIERSTRSTRTASRPRRSSGTCGTRCTTCRGEPQTFLPEFELVTKDLNTTPPRRAAAVHLRAAQARSRTRRSRGHAERLLDLQTIDRHLEAADPAEQAGRDPAAWCPASRSGPTWPRRPRRRTSSASTSRDCRTGWRSRRRPTGEKLIKRKTLQINFLRPTDDNRPQVTDIVPDDANGPAEKWIYRTVVVDQAEGAVSRSAEARRGAKD